MSPQKVEHDLPRELRSPAVEIVVEGMLGIRQQHGTVRRSRRLEFLREPRGMLIPD